MSPEKSSCAPKNSMVHPESNSRNYYVNQPRTSSAINEEFSDADIIPKNVSATQAEAKAHAVLLDQERYLPIANVVRIMKTQMDPQAKLAKDAKECVQECVSEFINFIASEAAEFCHTTKRKTITADDLLTALEATGFDNYAEPMRVFLMKYRQAHKVTGPIHRPHVNYVRPKQFANDCSLKPLFFDTEHGRRCTETQYVINGSEVVKNAPLGEEWNEQTGTLNVPLEYSNRSPISSDRPTKQAEIAQTSATTIDNSETVIALEQQQQMQIYVDPTSKQHYAAMETPNGMELYPIMIQDTPVQLESVTTGEHVLVHLNDDGASNPDAVLVSDMADTHSTDRDLRRKQAKRGQIANERSHNLSGSPQKKVRRS